MDNVKESYTSLLQTSQDFCVDDQTSSKTSLSSTSTFLTNRINDTIQHLYTLLRNYKTKPLPSTFSTEADQVYYHNPPGLLSIESLTIEVNDEPIPLEVINSQDKWDLLQQNDIVGSAIPKYYFPRRDDFGIYPTPGAVYTGTLVGNYLPRRLNIANYTAGTVVVTQNSAVVTGTDTTFTASMVGRYFCEADSDGQPIGNWYRIGSFASTTVLGLESVFEETSLSGSSYIIAQCPDLPDELHPFIPYHSSASFYATVRKDPEQAQRLLNFFYTGDYFNPNRGGGIKGGVLAIVNRYHNTGRNNSQIVNLHKDARTTKAEEAWSTTLS